MNRALAVLIVAALLAAASSTFGVSAARAQAAAEEDVESESAKVGFDGSQAAGATFGAALVTGIVCWTVEIANGAGQFARSDDVEERSDDFERTGWYLGGSGVYALEFTDEEKETESREPLFSPFPVQFDVSNRHSGGFRVRAGRRCHERFSVEAEVEWIKPFKAELKNSELGRLQDVTIAPVVGSINVKGYILTGRIQPYGLLGVGTMAVTDESKNTRDSESTTQTTGVLVVRGGGGIDFYVDRNWVLNVGVDYVYSATNIQILDFLSVAMGVQYRW